MAMNVSFARISSEAAKAEKISADKWLTAGEYSGANLRIQVREESETDVHDLTMKTCCGYRLVMPHR